MNLCYIPARELHDCSPSGAYCLIYSRLLATTGPIENSVPGRTFAG
jgi:hypothetical protein